MNFFDAQERSRRRTRYLIAVLLGATLVVALSVTVVVGAAYYLSTSTQHGMPVGQWATHNDTVLAVIALGTLAFIGFAALYRTTTLREGGGRVARDLGGTRVSADAQDPQTRQLVNVIEEMALASGVPVPEIYILEHESGINAFAAGFNPEDAAVAVTRGTLDHLGRDELQGVIAHEFSHILNGDMQLNIRLMGPMFGILAIGLLGQTLLRGMRFSRSSSRGKGGSGVAVVLIIGVGLTVTGWVGLFCARLIKASVSRQREYLADASAVQFTRQSSGIAGALKKIAGLPVHSRVANTSSEEISHMLFASGRGALSRMLASHPPILDRIQALDPGFSSEQLEELAATQVDWATEPTAAAQFASPAPSPAPPASTTVTTDAQRLAGTIGNPDEQQIKAAQVLNRAIPPTLRQALESGNQSLLLTLALTLHPDTSIRSTQLVYLTQQIGEQRCTVVTDLCRELDKLGPRFRLPLLELTLPKVKDRPLPQLEYLSQTMRHLIEMDARIELFEYAVTRVFAAYLRRAVAPALPPRASLDLGHRKAKQAAATVFASLAAQTYQDPEQAAAALQRGLAAIEASSISPDTLASAQTDGWMVRLDAALGRLQALSPRGKKVLVDGLMQTAIHDGRLSMAGSELLRAICAIIGCPLPPLVAAAA